MSMTPAEYNRQLPAPGDYARSWRTLTTLDPAMEISVPGFIVGMYGWGRQCVTAGEALRCVREALDRRINARAGYKPPEPREGEIPLYRDSRNVRDILTRRLRVYQFETRVARARFGHLLARHDD
jgi:hypothetical protein